MPFAFGSLNGPHDRARLFGVADPKAEAVGNEIEAHSVIVGKMARNRLPLELPQDARPEDRDFVQLLNERFLRIAEHLQNLATGALALSGDLDMKNFRIRNLGNAQVQTDAASVQFGDARWARLNHQHEEDEGEGGGALVAVTQTLFLFRQGTLAVQSSVFPVYRLAETKTPSEIIAMLKTEPTGADFKLVLQVDAVDYLTITIPAGAKTFSANTGLGAVTLNKDLVGNITQVGTTFPGADLSVLIRWRG